MNPRASISTYNTRLQLAHKRESDIMSDFDFMGDEFNPAIAAENNSDGDFAPLPKGTYRVRIVEADIEDMKSGNGKSLKLRMDVEGPSHAGRVVFERITLSHKTSEAAQQIGRALFGTLLLACGFDAKPNKISDLLGHVVDAKLKIEKSKDPKYDDKNRTVDFAKASGAMAPAAGGGGFNDDDIPF